MVGISDKRMEILYGSRTPALPLLQLSPSYSFPWQAVCRASPLLMATSHPLSENVPMLCHSTANHLSVLNQVGIESLDSFALVITPSLQEFEARHRHSIPESYSEYHRQGLDFSDPHECRHLSSLYHEDSVGESKRYAPGLR